MKGAGLASERGRLGATQDGTAAAQARPPTATATHEAACAAKAEMTRAEIRHARGGG